MRRHFIPIFLICAVVFTFAIRSAFLWRDFVFVYDQGRDALQVQAILHGHLTLIGPTTGLTGVFLGPFYYYLLAPLYLIGQGNPLVPAYAFVFLSALTIIPMFYLARRIAGTTAGVLATLAYAFSFVQWQYARWLSNPTPLPFLAILMFLCVLQALKTRKLSWYLAFGVLLGLCLQLEAANAFFLLPTLVSILLMEYVIYPSKQKLIKKLTSNLKLIILSGVGFGVTLIPQAIFELKHGFPITKSLIASFQVTSGTVVPLNIPARLNILVDLYAREWFSLTPWREFVLLVVIGSVLLIGYCRRRQLLSSQAFRVVLLWFCIPLVFHILYNGNHGNFWDYYVIGQYIPLFILVSCVLVSGAMNKGLLKLASIVFLCLTSLLVLIPNVHEWLGLFVPYNDRISLSLQLDAISWVETRAQGEPFGFWAYTPSAQDEVYKYLFSFKSQSSGILPVVHPEKTRLMYLLVEDDPNNPKRHDAWIKDQAKIGKIDAQSKFGAVTVFEVIRQ